MTARLQQIQNALKNIVLYYLETQKIDIEPSYNARVNGAETHVRVIAEKRLPYLVYDLMQQLHVLEKIEFEQPQASVAYVIQVIASITNFGSIWEQCLIERLPYTKTQLALNSLVDLEGEMDTYYQIMTGYAAKHSQ
ncbi:hypothetical protein [Mucilaginibacter sp. CSA2-8R]|uniref:hypothetical protein n=1 Tax=Mucilaginibacter sp. CSA2-8R TaxID=3141542 RepID=UPI00315CC5B4